MPTLVVGISSDVLYPLHEQQALHDMIPGSAYFVVDSDNGHGDDRMPTTGVMSFCMIVVLMLTMIICILTYSYLTAH